jgi:hypothetical protein
LVAQPPRGRLKRRLRAEGALNEGHIVSFASEDGHESYVVDQERPVAPCGARRRDVVQRLLQVYDVYVMLSKVPRRVCPVPAPATASRRDRTL